MLRQGEQAALEVMAQAAAALLEGREGAAAREWLASQGIERAGWRALGLGLHLGLAAFRSALEPEDLAWLREAGLLSERFLGCVLYPARDERGGLVTLHARRPEPGARAIAPPGAAIPRAPVYLDRALAAGERDVILVQEVHEAAVLQARGSAAAIAMVVPRLTRTQAEVLRQCGVESVRLRLGPAAAEAVSESRRVLVDVGLSMREADEAPLRRKKPRAPARTPIVSMEGPPYLERSDGLYRNTTPPVRMASFTARIVGEEVEDDGREPRRFYELEATLEGHQRLRARVPAEQFPRLRWVAALLGVHASIEPEARSRVAHAIQTLSGRVPTRTVHTATGWCEEGGRWLYLHAGGAVGTEGAVEREVRLPAPLDRFRLPTPPSEDALRGAVAASLRLLEVAPRVVTVPLHAAMWRAALGGGLALGFEAVEHELEERLLAPFQQHWGAELEPGSTATWVDPAAGEELVERGKDVLLVLPCSIRTGRHVRATLLRAGSAPVGPRPSFAVRLGAGELSHERLEDCARAGRAGLHAAAMAGFLAWLAGKGPRRVREELISEAAGLRPAFSSPGVPGSAAQVAAQLFLGLELFLELAVACGALSPSGSSTLRGEARTALHLALVRQVDPGETGDPAQRLMALLLVALARGTAHVADEEGRAPASPLAWGWRAGEAGEWESRGQRVGWTAGGDLFLDRRALLLVLRGSVRGRCPWLAPWALARVLNTAGLLVSTSPGRRTLAVRRSLEGKRREVLHLRVAALHGTSEVAEESAHLGNGYTEAS